MTIRVLLADDHTLMRKGLRALLATAADIDVVGEVRTGLEAERQVLQLGPDVVLMDILWLVAISTLDQAAGDAVESVIECVKADGVAVRTRREAK